MIIYCFDLKVESLKKYNTVKRRFYYDLNKINILKSVWRTKSVILAPEEKEIEFDTFFSKYKDYTTLFKGKISLLERVY